MKIYSPAEVWFVTGSQHLYGERVLQQVADHSNDIAAHFHNDSNIATSVIFKPVLKTAEEIYALCQLANNTPQCIGIITWMHTFSPAKMWINGLKILQKPLLHLHTQYNRDIPWNEIDMDFMNLNQSAHGDREAGYMMTRMKIKRKIVVGHWKDENVISKINAWIRAAAAWNDWQGAKYVRFGDNMRYVAVTDGDKVEAEIKFGYSVNTYGIGDLVNIINGVNGKEIDDLCSNYDKVYEVSSALQKDGLSRLSLYEAAKIEIGLRRFLKAGNYKGFTDTFEDLHGLLQLPGIAVQRLMNDGYGFGAEGDWKTAALVRAMKIMGSGLPGGNSFMEDYTYHFEPGNEMVLGAHMLEICPSIASNKPSCEIHPLGIGSKADPVRLVFNVNGGPALNASMIDMGKRFRLLVNEVEAVGPIQEMPRLPVARVLWKPKPDMYTGCAAWLLAGGAHHTCYSQNVTTEMLEDFARIAGIELVLINEQTTMRALEQELRMN
ncbi:MAG TPA: L-arabinose isomerase, partial [Flavitalea sp.]|nr:L-arabinose isomerase [Flavitalea sp.]